MKVRLNNGPADGVDIEVEPNTVAVILVMTKDGTLIGDDDKNPPKGNRYYYAPNLKGVWRLREINKKMIYGHNK